MKIRSNSGRILSFHPRRQHNFEQAASLAELYPKTFTHITSMYFPPVLVNLLRRITPRYGNLLAKRSYYKLPKKYVHVLPSTEIRKYLLSRKHEPTPSDFMNLNEYWQKVILRHFKPPEVCISYDGISHLLFREWKGKSLLVLDLAIGLPQYRIKIMHGDRFHNGMLDELDEDRRKLFSWYSEEVELADIILCGSEFVKKTVLFFYPEFENKCKILPYGVELEAFSYPERIFQQRDDLKFVFVGRLGWRKGADLMLDAWRDFVRDHPQAELHFFGTADKEIVLDPLPEKVYLHGRVKTTELVEHLKKMDVFVFPTTFEGSSIAVFQAMALKLPVITTLNSGTVLKHGESCEIVEVGNKAELVQSMDKLFRDEEYRKMLAENAFSQSIGYTWNDYTLRLSKILNRKAYEPHVKLI